MRYEGSGAPRPARVPGACRADAPGRAAPGCASGPRTPRAAPHILFNYLSTGRDRRELRDSVHLTREILRAEGVRSLARRGARPRPGVRSDDEIDAFVRENIESAFHPCGTCRMGTDDRAVTDGETRVHGTEGLR